MQSASCTCRPWDAVLCKRLKMWNERENESLVCELLLLSAFLNILHLPSNRYSPRLLLIEVPLFFASIRLPARFTCAIFLITALAVFIWDDKPVRWRCGGWSCTGRATATGAAGSLLRQLQTFSQWFLHVASLSGSWDAFPLINFLVLLIRFKPL